jgi:hypothetical protein
MEIEFVSIPGSGPSGMKKPTSGRKWAARGYGYSVASGGSTSWTLRFGLKITRINK